jgi:hypothetical protein
MFVSAKVTLAANSIPRHFVDNAGEVQYEKWVYRYVRSLIAKTIDLFLGFVRQAGEMYNIHQVFSKFVVTGLQHALNILCSRHFWE